MKTNSLLLFGLLAPAPVMADTLINNTFSGGATTWYSGGAATNLTASGNTLTVVGLTVSNLGGQGVVASFEPSGTELNLQVGQSIQLSFNYLFTVTNNTDFGLGFGFYNTAGKPLTTSGTGFNKSQFNAWKGYSAFGIFGGADNSSQGRFHLAERATTANNLLTPFQTGLLGTTHQTDGLQAGIWYAASLTLTYASATNMMLKATIGNESFTTSAAPFITGVDSVGITSGEPVGSLELSGITVVTIPSAAPVPEPSTLALAGLGLGALGWICWRRQHGAGGF